MKPYLLKDDELNTISELQKKKLSSEEMWKDASVQAIKSNIKRHYIAEQEQKCAYCKLNFRTNHGMVWDTDHIIDKNSFPQWTFEPLNLCISCKDCNQAKGISPVTKSVNYKLFPNKKNNYCIVHAHFDNYEDHIEVAVPGLTYRYKTDKGRETISVCGLLRYHKEAGRTDIDPTLQAVLHFAGDKQTPEALKNAYDLILKIIGAK
ncbi:HNH endonuclease [Raoultella planticola]|uniref:HNH endonuclease n=1 Tax=Raoultella planticola TaxID=575 RepID=UPI001A2F5109|nr:hypothetical protein [Raoultella planticola]MCE9859363.1 hypothetical protein [Raoultella planticola]HAT2179298.1 HNH endonuclease [Raoultella ornithinolytica]HAT2557588.1 HNH endonuclease [Raoultella ornithinolytica]HAT3645255.1 HNH endonuclease [Raoultella ornithinolytica]